MILNKETKPNQTNISDRVYVDLGLNSRPGLNPLILQLWVKYYEYYYYSTFTRITLAVNDSRMFIWY